MLKELLPTLQQHKSKLKQSLKKLKSPQKTQNPLNKSDTDEYLAIPRINLIDPATQGIVHLDYYGAQKPGFYFVILLQVITAILLTFAVVISDKTNKVSAEIDSNIRNISSQESLIQEGKLVSSQIQLYNTFFEEDTSVQDELGPLLEQFRSPFVLEKFNYSPSAQSNKYVFDFESTTGDVLQFTVLLDGLFSNEDVDYLVLKEASLNKEESNYEILMEVHLVK